MAIYGFYVANQTSGIYFFSVWIFVIPFVAVGYVILSAMERRSRAADGVTPAPRSRDYPASVPPKREVQRAPAGRTQPPPVSRATTPPANSWHRLRREGPRPPFLPGVRQVVTTSGALLPAMRCARSSLPGGRFPLTGEEMDCDQCGQPLPDQATHCSACGSAQAASGAPLGDPERASVCDSNPQEPSPGLTPLTSVGAPDPQAEARSGLSPSQIRGLYRLTSMGLVDQCRAPLTADVNASDAATVAAILDRAADDRRFRTELASAIATRDFGSVVRHLDDQDRAKSGSSTG